MSTTDSLADPIFSSVASVLRVPLLELYALLWRVGIVEIVQPDRTHRRAPRFSSRVAPRATGTLCPDPSAHAAGRPHSQSRRASA
ncbi:Rv1535 domain-containing protein [Mycobacterium sp. Aquia_216]|uniref:Rv1535 domain-containing protein n=1 Tax=Mycobacterium sp. Aquia_216 TaxID=2991729 RepID=UPI00227A45F7|nr:Rv1535 domain-containing protein [Mycobacterium sp. Aquia_216]WAJ45873.1 Rv1535 domain-containing protein [Mycobacterium sp. Aquia_216]